MTKRLPPDFLFGYATSAFQIEGATREDGRGESIWERFCRVPGAIADGSDGEVACDHYHRWAEDVDLLASLGAQAYRFSVAWPRIQPAGRGAPNPKGLDFYDRLVDALLARGVRPFVTLYHWDLPQALQEEGGWTSRGTAEAFAEYAELVAQRLGDRVRDWATHNEPWCVAHLGHHTGEQAPGLKDPGASLRAAHHVLLSHGWAVPRLRQRAPGARVGIVLNPIVGIPASPSTADRETVRSMEARFTRWYLDPLFRGSYPADGVADLLALGQLERETMPWVRAGDLSSIAEPLDYLGVNYYARSVCRAAIPEDQNEPRTVPEPSEKTDMGWPVVPEGLTDLLAWLHREYRPAELIVTENGAAYGDGPSADGRVHDARRVAYLEGHLAAVRRAVALGVPVRGYFLWSLLDNFEWAFGFEKRFGAVWVDYATQRRVPKDSALWYRDVILASTAAAAPREAR